MPAPTALTNDQLTSALSDLQGLNKSQYAGLMQTLSEQNLAVMSDVVTLQNTIGIPQDTSINTTATGLQLLIQQSLDLINNLQLRVSVLETQMSQGLGAP
jgi:hypothetical protein